MNESFYRAVPPSGAAGIFFHVPKSPMDHAVAEAAMTVLSNGACRVRPLVQVGSLRGIADASWRVRHASRTFALARGTGMQVHGDNAIGPGAVNSRVRIVPLVTPIADGCGVHGQAGGWCALNKAATLSSTAAVRTPRRAR